MRKRVIAGNWKMNKDIKETIDFINAFKYLYKPDDNTKVVICAPYTLIGLLARKFRRTGVSIGGQNFYYKDKGAYTGEISADMLESAGASYVIIGHSERREIFGETDDMVNQKLLKAIQSGLSAILCCGETLSEREGGKLEDRITYQIKSAFIGVKKEDAKNVIIAYEPIWAIGTGKVATPDDADSACKIVRNVVEELYGSEIAEEILILYGGSMNEKNAKELLDKPNIDGGLIGGASLVAEKFCEVISC